MADIKGLMKCKNDMLSSALFSADGMRVFSSTPD